MLRRKLNSADRPTPKTKGCHKIFNPVAGNTTMCEWPDFDAISIHYKVPCAKESQKGDVLDRFIDASFGSLTVIVVELLSCWLSQTRVSAAGRHLRHNSQWPIHWEVINIGSPSSSTLTRSGKDVETAMFDLAAEQAASFEGRPTG